jgi:hypothetical protein
MFQQNDYWNTWNKICSIKLEIVPKNAYGTKNGTHSKNRVLGHICSFVPFTIIKYII